MYKVVDELNRVVAWHEHSKVVTNYIHNVITTSHRDKIILKIKKVKKKDASEFEEHYHELHLVPYNKTYIQEKYVDSISCVEDDVIDNELYAIDLLYRILELHWDDMTKRQRNKLSKAIQVLMDIYDIDAAYTPDIASLEDIRIMVESFKDRVREVE